MTETYWLGPCPSDEEPASTLDTDFHERNKAECRAFIQAIKRVCGEPPEGAVLRIKTEQHEYGAYRECIVEFDGNNPEAAAYAAKCDESAPTTWEAAGMTTPAREARGR
jgi:hypothetical protein